jgi:hypothetical protein
MRKKCSHYAIYHGPDARRCIDASVDKVPLLIVESPRRRCIHNSGGGRFHDVS